MTLAWFLHHNNQDSDDNNEDENDEEEKKIVKEYQEKGRSKGIIGMVLSIPQSLPTPLTLPTGEGSNTGLHLQQSNNSDAPNFGQNLAKNQPMVYLSPQVVDPKRDSEGTFRSSASEEILGKKLIVS